MVTNASSFIGMSISKVFIARRLIVSRYPSGRRQIG